MREMSQADALTRTGEPDRALAFRTEREERLAAHAARRPRHDP
jgi:hypothetical protein